MEGGDCADVQRRLVHLGRLGDVGLSALRNDPRGSAQHHVQSCPVTPHEIAQPLRDGEHSLAHRQTRKDVIREVCSRLHHAPGIARGANATAFAGIGHEVIVSTIVTPRPGKAVGKDAAFRTTARTRHVPALHGPPRVVANKFASSDASCNPGPEKHELMNVAICRHTALPCFLSV